MNRFEEEELRIVSAYSRRDSRGKRSLYSWHRADTHIQKFRIHVAAARFLKKAGWLDLGGKDFLDIGCGAGGWLRTLMEWGAEAGRLHGIDLLPERIEEARRLGPQIDYKIASGWQLPFDSSSFDFVSAHTVFSSILDIKARSALAHEISRVIKPEGLVFIFDFRFSSPANPDTVGINSAEIDRLFPGAQRCSTSLILAPMIQRRVASISPDLALAAEMFCPFLRTHVYHCLSSFKLRGCFSRICG